jgi:signal transduction histidine kinase
MVNAAAICVAKWFTRQQRARRTLRLADWTAETGSGWGREASQFPRYWLSLNAEAAVPLASDGTVLLLSAPLRAESRSAALISHRILLAAGAAVPAVLLLGYLGARILARRIGRLKVAARRIAEGQFDDPIEDPASDDLGQLAQELETMRGQLARLDSARRAFIANASHELRTPLFSIGGFLEMLDDEELDRNTQREFIQTTRAQLDRLTRLSLDLLDLSRLDVGRMPHSREPVRLSQVAIWSSMSFLPPRRSSDTDSTYSLAETASFSATTNTSRASPACSSKTRFATRRPEPLSRSSSQAPTMTGGSVSKTQDRASPHLSST